MGKLIRCSSGPEPFPNIPIREPLHPQQPGEILIRYEVEAAGGCHLNVLGWCCFGALCCVALPLSWLPFACSTCKKKYQRPVYGYPMDCLSFIAAQDAAWLAQKTAAAPTAVPTIHCMDVTLLASQEPVQQDQQEQRRQHQASMPGQVQVTRFTPSPPPLSIFVPPSAVPTCGFTADNPFPSRFSPAAGYSPSRPLAFGAGDKQPPRATSPMPGTGLPIVGMVDMQQQQLELQRMQLIAAQQQQQQQQQLQQQQQQQQS